MVGTVRAILVLGAMLISACAPTTAPSAIEADLKTADATKTQLAEFRRLEIERHHKHIISEERMHEACAPWKESCVWVAPANARPALRGEAPFQAQLTPPDNYVTEELGEVSFDDWQERHFCGGSLIAPGWVITAAHCVDSGMVEDGFQVRLGMSNLQRFEGRTFPIERVICFSEEDCVRGASGVVYEHDIALLKFAFDPSDFKPAPPMEAFENVGIYMTDVSPDQSYLTTWSEDNTVRVWDIANGQELTRDALEPYPWIGPMSEGDFNEVSSKTMIGRSDTLDPELGLYGAYAVEDLETHNIQGFPDWYHSGSLTTHSYRFFNQGERLLVKRDQWGVEGYSNLSWVWSGTSTEDGIVFGAPRSFGYSDAMELSPDEQVLITVATPELEAPQNRKNSILAWNPATLDFLWEYVVHNRMQNSGGWFSGRGLRQFGFAEPGVVFGYDDEVFILDDTSGAVLARYQHPRSEPWLNTKRRQVFAENDPYFPIESDGAWVQNNVQDAQLVWTMRGDELVTLTRRFAESDVWVWDTARREVRLRLKHEDPLWSEYVEGAQAISGGDRLFTWTNYGTLRVWDLTSGELISKMRQELPLLKGIFVNGDRNLIVQDSAGATVWDLNTGKQIARVDHLSEVLSLTVAEDETQFLTTSYDGTARVWNAQTGREMRRIYHDGTVYGASFIAEGEKILSWSDDGTSRITKLETGDAEMIFDVAKAPPGSPLTSAVADRPEEPIAVSYLPLPDDAHELTVGGDVTIYGWGKTEAVVGEDPYASLLSVTLSVMDNADCLMMEGMGPTSKGERRVHENVFCAFDEIQKTCRGDSGGPVIQDGVLVGIVSWGKKQCKGDGMPGVYTRVHNYRDWIREHVLIEVPQPIVVAIDMEDLND